MVEQGKYRTKPAEITAFRWEGQPSKEWPTWARNSLRIRYETTNLQIDGKHGTVRCNNGDWVIHLSADDVYPCADPIFRAKYDLILEDTFGT